ncbi:8991_t:CDS:2 [Entrophospora sp. SA101]|nr:8991_t:CDS:2 [Entrophospora sp. SA101]
MECSLPFQIGSNITIKNYNTFLNNYGSEGYKFYFKLNSDNKTGSVYIIDMATNVHEAIVNLLQKFFKVPNRGVIYDPPMLALGQSHEGIYSSGFEIAPDVAVYPNTALVSRPVNSIIVPHPPRKSTCTDSVQGSSEPKCWSFERKVLDLDVSTICLCCYKYQNLDPRSGIREPRTGYFYRTMMAKLYRQGMEKQEWDFGNVIKHSRDPINEPAPCNAPNLPNFQINIPISEVFWDLTFPIPPGYAPVIPPAITVNNFTTDLYQTSSFKI